MRNWLSTLALSLVTVTANAAVVEFAATLTPGQEVGTVVLNGSTPSGTAGLVLNTDSLNFSWVISFQGLTGNAIAAHFHNAAVGVDGGVVVDIEAEDLFGGTDGIGQIAGSFSGGTTLSQALADELLAGRFYINIHTGNNPGGEIRSQVLSGTFNPVPLPAAVWLMLPALGALALRRRA